MLFHRKGPVAVLLVLNLLASLCRPAWPDSLYTDILFGVLAGFVLLLGCRLVFLIILR